MNVVVTRGMSAEEIHANMPQKTTRWIYCLQILLKPNQIRMPDGENNDCTVKLHERSDHFSLQKQTNSAKQRSFDHKPLIFIWDENYAEFKLWLLPSCSESCSTPPNRVSEIEIIHWLWLMCHADMLCPSFQPENDICRSLSRAIMTGSKHLRLSRGVNDQNVV